MRKSFLFIVTVAAMILVMNFTVLADDTPPLVGIDNYPVQQDADD